jgi:hypothetical protein
MISSRASRSPFAAGAPLGDRARLSYPDRPDDEGSVGSWCSRIASEVCSEMRELSRTPLSRLPNVAAPASSSPRRLMQQAAASAPNANAVDPAELVSRALAILVEEDKAWQARREANLPPTRAR